MTEKVGVAKVVTQFDPAQTAKAADAAITPAFEQIAKKGATLLAGLFVGRKLFDVGKEGLAELEQAQRVGAQTTVALKNLGDQTPLTQGHIEDLATSMLKLAGFDDEAAQAAENVLTSFRRVAASTATFDRATKDSADLATELGIDLPAAAQILGRALEAPDKAARSLRSANIILSQSQQDQIKQFTATGNSAAAMEVVFQAVESRVKGSAAAFGQTLPGELKIAREEISNAKGSLVEGLAPALSVAAEGATFLAEGVQELPGPLRTLTSVSLVAGVGIAGIAAPISNLVSAVVAVKAARAAALPVIAAETVATTESTIATTSLATADLVAARSTATFAEAEVALNEEHALLVTNSSVVVEGLYAQSAAEEALTVSSGGLTAALGVAGLVGATVGITAAVLAYGTAQQADTEITVDYTKAVKSNGDAFKDNADSATALAISHSSVITNAQKAGLSLGALIRVVREGNTDFGKLRNSLDLVRDAAGRVLPHDVAPTFHQLATALRDAGSDSTEFGRNLSSLADQGKLTRDEIGNIINVAAGLSGKLQGTKADTDIMRGALEDAGLSAEEVDTALGTLKDTSGLDAQKNAADALKGSLDAATASLDAIHQAQRALLPAELRAQSGQANIAAANQKVADAKKELDSGVGAQKADLDRAVRDARERLTDAQGQAATAGQIPTSAKPRTPAEQAAAERTAANQKVAAQRSVRDAQEALTAALAKQKDGAGLGAAAQAKYDQAVRDAEAAVNDQAEALTELQVQQDAANGKTDTSSQQFDIYRSNLGTLTDAIQGPVHTGLLTLIGDLDNTATSADAALTQILALRDAMGANAFSAGGLFSPGSGGQGAGLGVLLSNKTTPPSSVVPIKKFDTGGFVDAPLGAAVPAIVHGGEFVLSTGMLEGLKGGGGSRGQTTNIGTVNFIGDHGRTPIAKLSAELAVRGALVAG